MNDRDSIFLGFFLGAVFPIIGFVLVEFIFGLLTDAGLMDAVSTSTMSRRTRTLALIGICFNLIPFNFAKSRRLDNTMRGIIFPTLIYVGFWMYQYSSALF